MIPTEEEAAAEVAAAAAVWVLCSTTVEVVCLIKGVELGARVKDTLGESGVLDGVTVEHGVEVGVGVELDGV